MTHRTIVDEVRSVRHGCEVAGKERPWNLHLERRDYERLCAELGVEELSEFEGMVIIILDDLPPIPRFTGAPEES